MKKLLKLVLLVAWMAVIFSMSQQNGEMSQLLSDGLLAKLNLPPYMSLIVRKAAHFSEYFILALLFKWNFPKLNKRLLLYCFLFACSDEFHQLFVSGRAGRFLDVIIDALGSLAFLFLYRLIKRNAE